MAAQYKGLQLAIDSALKLPRIFRANAGKLRQAPVNLLSSALKFIHESGITLHVKADSHDKPTRLSFAVIDTGCGIAADELQSLGPAIVRVQAGRQNSENRPEPQYQPWLHSIDGRRTQHIKRAGAWYDSRIRHRYDRRVVALAAGQPHCRILVGTVRSRILRIRAQLKQALLY